MSFSINWPNLIVQFSLFLEILKNMCIVIICSALCDVIDFEIKLSFLSSLLPTWQKKVRKKTYLQIEKGFSDEVKNISPSFLKDSQLPEMALDLRVYL